MCAFSQKLVSQPGLRQTLDDCKYLSRRILNFSAYFQQFLCKTFHAVEWCFGAFQFLILLFLWRKRFQLNYNLIFTIMFIYLEAAAAAVLTQSQKFKYLLKGG
jgi:MFS superfamily sulfate permease-like transporter